MIKTQEFNGQQFVVQENHGVTPISEYVFLEIEKQNKQLQQYKSIVKKVDPDDFPKDDVWAWCEEGLYFGTIRLIFKSACYDQLVIDTFNDKFYDPTHYIEKKDLIKLFTGDV